MDLQQLIDVDGPISVSTPNDDAASTSSLIHEESEPVGPRQDRQDPPAQEAGPGDLPLDHSKQCGCGGLRLYRTSPQKQD